MFLKGHTTSNTAGGSNTHTHVVPGHYHYYGDHWSNDDSRLGHYPYGNGSGNTLQDGVVYGARTNGAGYHGHTIYASEVSHADGGGWPSWRRLWTASDRGGSGGGNITGGWANEAGSHEHDTAWHRHYIQARTTHGPINIDGRNDMTSGSSSTQPKFITVLYVMRIK